jgi:FMN-dependent NADH-azoreductase
MTEILYISCSPKDARSISDGFGQEIVAWLRLQNPSATVNRRALSTANPPFVNAAFCAAIVNPADAPDAFDVSDVLIAELRRADAIVIATPMHNYTVPAVLKAWIDQVVRINSTFISTQSGKIGQLTDRPVFIAVASGGWFTGPSPTGTPPQPDFLTPYLRAVLNTIGLTSLYILPLEGVTRGPEMLARSLERARAALARIPVPDL